MEVKASVSPQPTEIVNIELSPSDKFKIQKAYGCDSCGGPQTGDSGDLKAASDETEGSCLWWLTSANTKQIVIDIQVRKAI